MKTVNVHEAKRYLSRLLDRAHGGEEVIITKGGEPYVRLMPLAVRTQRRAGTLRGRIEIGKAFFAHLPSRWAGES